MLSKFQHMWDGDLGQFKAGKFWIELISLDKWPICLPSYLAGPQERELMNHEIGEIVVMDVIKLPQTEWVLPILSAPKKNGTIRFCVDYRKLNEVLTWDSYLISHIDECIESLWTPQYSLHYMPIAGIGKWKLLMKVVTKQLSYLLKGYSSSVECHLILTAHLVRSRVRWISYDSWLSDSPNSFIWVISS